MHHDTNCKGHKHYLGGIMDGRVQCLTIAHPSDYPTRIATLKRQGQRSWYVRDDQASNGTAVVYRFVGLSGDTQPGEPDSNPIPGCDAQLERVRCERHGHFHLCESSYATHQGPHECACGHLWADRHPDDQ